MISIGELIVVEINSVMSGRITVLRIIVLLFLYYLLHFKEKSGRT